MYPLLAPVCAYVGQPSQEKLMTLVESRASACPVYACASVAMARLVASAFQACACAFAATVKPVASASPVYACACAFAVKVRLVASAFQVCACAATAKVVAFAFPVCALRAFCGHVLSQQVSFVLLFAS